MEIAMEESGTEPRELTLDELEDASGGIVVALIGIAFCLGWIGGLLVGHYYTK